MSHIHYEEEQRFTSLRWLWIAVFITLMIPLLMIDKSTSTKDLMMLWGSVLLGLIPVVVILVYTSLQLKVDSTGFHYRLMPGVWNWKSISPAMIKTIAIRDHKSFLEKISIGHQRNLFTRVTRMNITGTRFIDIHLQDGRTLCIGTNNAEGLKQAIERLLSNPEA